MIREVPLSAGGRQVFVPKDANVCTQSAWITLGEIQLFL